MVHALCVTISFAFRGPRVLLQLNGEVLPLFVVETLLAAQSLITLHIHVLTATAIKLSPRIFVHLMVQGVVDRAPSHSIK